MNPITAALIRIKGGYPEGICYAILLMNPLSPVLDGWFKPKRFAPPSRPSDLIRMGSVDPFGRALATYRVKAYATRPIPKHSNAVRSLDRPPRC